MTRTLLITGASSGIGAAVARVAAASGWQTALVARGKGKLEALARELGPAAIALPGDVADLDSMQNAVDQCVRRFGALDAVLANAGTGARSAGTEAGDPENWREMTEANVWGLLTTAKASLPELRKRRGHFLVMGSNAGRRHLKGSVYGATKWFARGFAGNLSLEMAQWGGRCTLISPGMVDTPFFEKKPERALNADDVARAVIYAIDQPEGVDVGEINVVPNPAAFD